MNNRSLKSLIVAPIPSAAERSAGLAQQAKDLANEALVEVMDKIVELESEARGLSGLQPLPPGVREQLRQLADNLLDRGRGITVIRGRS